MSYNTPHSMRPWPVKAAGASTGLFINSLMLFVVAILVLLFSLEASPIIATWIVRLAALLNLIGMGLAIAALVGAGSATGHSVVPRALIGLVLNGLIIGFLAWAIINRIYSDIGGMGTRT